MKMFPLIDGAEYKLFDAKMFSLTDGARNKLFGTKMFTPSPLRRWGFFIGDSLCLFPKVTSITSVILFFQLAADDTLMSNYENGHYRPHFLAVKDSQNSDIFWMIPVSSRYAKFQGIHDKQVAKYGRCTKIVLGNCGGRDAAFLIQNAFPVTADFFDHIHTSQGQPLTLHEGTAKTIVSNLHNNLKLHKRGIRLFFADIDRIYHLMEEHLASSESNVQSANHKKPVAIGDMTRQNLDEELQKGVDSLNNVGFTADEVDDLFNNAKSNS